MFLHLILYAGIQATITIVILEFIDPRAPLTIAYWVVSTITAIMYVLVQLKDPGYLQPLQPTFNSAGCKQLDTPLASDNRRLSQSEPQLAPPPGMKNRHCLICHSIQPLRTKHCHECNKCVLTFDHHCPFMGTCIGEKNRAVFYFYLVMEVCQLVLAVFVLRTNYAEWQAHYRLGLVFALALVLAVLLGTLLVFHTYLMFKGITTWQYFSWQNITYLSNVPNYMNPFSKSTWSNLKDYWAVTFKKQPHHWVPC